MSFTFEPLEHHLEVRRTARYWTAGSLPSVGAGDLWIVLHGYKQLARRFLRRFEPIVSEGRLVVAPEALSRFYVGREEGRHGPESIVGGTWMTREDRLHEISDYVAYLDRLAEHLGAAGHRLTVLGFSQGVATAMRWAVRGTVRPARVVLWGDTVPPDLDEAATGQALEGVEIVLVRGDEDRAVGPVRVADEAERLERVGVPYRTIRYPGGHDIDAETLIALAAE